MNLKLLLIGLALVSASTGTCNAFSVADRAVDLDGDGLPDTITATSSSNADATVKKTYKIFLSGSKKSISAALESDTGSLAVYPGGVAGDLVVDRTNRSSRDSAELSYDVYRWSAKDKTLCLSVSISGAPANQLEDEVIPSDTAATHYKPCSALDSGSPAVRLEKSAAERYVLEGLPQAKTRDIPEYYAIELATIISPTNVREINDAAYFQLQRGNATAAAIVLDAIHKKMPDRVVATLNLADAYKAAGNTKLACPLYAEYKKDMTATNRAAEIPKRLNQLSECK